MIDLRDSAVMFDAQVMNDGAVFPVFPTKVDVIGGIFFTLRARAQRLQLL